jgi:lysophospholipase L1-like esterase
MNVESKRDAYYFWGDGMKPRQADGLVWKREDFAGDGVHPSLSGRRKVADMLLIFFAEDALAKSWFKAR